MTEFTGRDRLVSRRAVLATGGVIAGALGLEVRGAMPALATVGAMQWPITGDVTSLIGMRNGKMHEGIDIGAPVGTPVYAAASGTVVASQSYSGYGNTVILEHGVRCTNLPMRWFSLYGHLSSSLVAKGATVRQGQQIASSGNTGTSTGPHLHFEAITNTGSDATAALNGTPFQGLNAATAVGRRVTARTSIGVDFIGLASETSAPPAYYFVGIGAPDSSGYWLAARDGGVFTFGGREFFGSMGGRALNAPVVGIAPRRTGDGYWLVGSDGGIFAFGAAGFFGSMGGQPLNKPVVGMAGHPSGNGYWLVGSDGGIFAFGAAGFFGSMGGQPLNKPVVGMAAHPSGNGYWLVGSDGGIFAFGAAGFFGSMGGQPLNKPVVGMAAHPSGNGYWLIGGDGGIFAFGEARNYGNGLTFDVS
jgi:hypothetical protein